MIIQRTLPTALTLAFLLAGCSGSGGGGSSAGVMQAGKWQMTTEVVDMKVAGMPAGVAMPKPAPVTTTTCMTPAQAQVGPGDMMMKSTPDCTVSKNSNSGGKLSLEMTCKSPMGPVTTKIDGTYAATEMTMTSETSTSGAHATTTKAKITSKRIGDCGA